MECADTLLVLTNNKAVLAHRAILSNHSTVLCDMLNHNAATLKPGYKLKVPFLDFAEDETFTLLAYLYATSPSFPSVDAALVVARFSHKFDAPDALRRAEVYLIDYISSSIFATEVSVSSQCLVACSVLLATANLHWPSMSLERSAWLIVCLCTM